MKRNSPEKKIEMEILGFLRAIDVFCWKNESTGIFDPVKKTFRSNKNPYKINGVSDILGVIQGRMLAIEVKSPVGRLTDEQRIFLAKVNECNGIGFVARSLEQCVDQLLPHFPNNEALKRFSKDYVSSKGADH